MNTDITDEELYDFFISNSFYVDIYVKKFFDEEEFVFKFDSVEDCLKYESLM
jgi:hypothetical protein